MEIWKDVENYEGLYQVSNLGNVKSLDREINDNRWGYKIISGKELKKRKHSSGHLSVMLYKESKSKAFQIHRLVLNAFKSNDENKPCVNHIDNDPSNNNINNLEWVTYRENTCHYHSINPLTSKYTGVCYDKARNKWKSKAQIKNKQYNLGRFDTEEQAYKARVEFEIKNNISNKYI
jgi:hypothetical protein